MFKEIDGLPQIETSDNSFHRRALVQALTTGIPVGKRFDLNTFKGHIKRTEWILNTLFKMSCISRDYGGDPEGKSWIRKFDPRSFPDTKFPYACAGCVFAKGKGTVKCVILSTHHQTQRYP